VITLGQTKSDNIKQMITITKQLFVSYNAKIETIKADHKLNGYRTHVSVD
jgi:uncharacterized protein (DUF302 family)